MCDVATPSSTDTPKGKVPEPRSRARAASPLTIQVGGRSSVLVCLWRVLGRLVAKGVRLTCSNCGQAAEVQTPKMFNQGITVLSVKRVAGIVVKKPEKIRDSACTFPLVSLS